MELIEQLEQVSKEFGWSLRTVLKELKWSDEDILKRLPRYCVNATKLIASFNEGHLIAIQSALIHYSYKASRLRSDLEVREAKSIIEEMLKEMATKKTKE